MIEDTQPPVARRVLNQLVLLVGLVLLWCMLWGSFTVLTIVTGIVLAVGVSFVFFLPAVELSGRVQPLRLLWFVVVLVLDIVRASAQIAWVVIKPWYRPSNGVIAVQLSTKSDLMMAWTATAVSIVPGSIVVDQDREASILYLHAMDVRTEADLERIRENVRRVERRLLLAVGSREEALAAKTEDVDTPRGER